MVPLMIEDSRVSSVTLLIKQDRCMCVYCPILMVFMCYEYCRCAIQSRFDVAMKQLLVEFIPRIRQKELLTVQSEFRFCVLHGFGFAFARRSRRLYTPLIYFRFHPPALENASFRQRGRDHQRLPILEN